MAARGPNQPSATRSLYIWKSEPIASPPRTGRKLRIQSGRVPETRRACQTLQACGQTASEQRSGAAKWSPVRETLVQCWPNNAPPGWPASSNMAAVCVQTAQAGLRSAPAGSDLKTWFSVSDISELFADMFSISQEPFEGSFSTFDTDDHLNPGMNRLDLGGDRISNGRVKMNF